MGQIWSNAQTANGYLWVGGGNAAADFQTVEQTDVLQLGLTARQAGTGTTYLSTGSVFKAPLAGTDIRFAYSVATHIQQLSDFVIKLQMDMDPSSGVKFKTFILEHSSLVPSGNYWVHDADGNGQISPGERAQADLINSPGAKNGSYIRDDGNNGDVAGDVSQNIENLAWFDSTPLNGYLQKGSYEIRLEASNSSAANLLTGTLTKSIFLEVAGGALQLGTKSSDAELIANAKNGTDLLVGTGNRAADFQTVQVSDSGGNVLELGLTARSGGATGNGATYASSVVGGVKHYAIDDAINSARFAYSVASDINLKNFDVKMLIDTDKSAGTSFKTFFLSEETGTKGGFKWILDKNGNGILDDDDIASPVGNIVDDGGNGFATQNIENAAWFDGVPDASVAAAALEKGSYDIVLQAFDKGTGYLSQHSPAVIENRIVLDIAGGAPPVNSGGGGGGGSVTPPVSPPATPNFPDPTPNDDFNEAQAAKSVASFFTGEAPTPEKQAALEAFAALQYEAYAAMGVANPALGPYEALGRGFAETIEFAEKYGAQTEADFIYARYQDVFGRMPSTVQQAHFQAQIDYFEALYEGVGINSDQADLFAKGAVLGQMLGHAALDPTTVTILTTSKSTGFADWDLAA